MAGEGGENLALLVLRHLEVVERQGQLCRHGIELIRGDAQLAMCLFKGDCVVPGLGAGIRERTTRDVTDPKGPHELQAREARQLGGVPFAKCRVVGPSAGDSVLDYLVAKAVDQGCDREDATKSLVEALFGHRPVLPVVARVRPLR